MTACKPCGAPLGPKDNRCSYCKSPVPGTWVQLESRQRLTYGQIIETITLPTPSSLPLMGDATLQSEPP